MADSNSTKPNCKYGAKCYRKNEEHLKNFGHPSSSKRTTDDDEDVPTSSKRQRLNEESDESLTSDIEETRTAEMREECDQPSRCEDEDDTVVGEEPATPPGVDIKEELRLKFKVEMPQDFFDFWDYCKSVNPSKPCDALLEDVGFQLVGPYDVMAGRLKVVKGQRPKYVLHYRYFYDPPEFQTVIAGDKATQHHLGYYRDEPVKPPVFVAANSATQGCTIAAQGENLFAAVKLHIEKLIKQTKDSSKAGTLKKREKSLVEWAKKCNHSLEPRTKGMKERDKKVVTRTFHKAGIVVPIDSSGVGYRELPETDGTLKKILKKIVESENETEKAKYLDELQEIITFVQFANDECDYGEGYELGLDLFSYGDATFHSTIGMLLSVAYQLLGRQEFGDILEAHLLDRQRDDVSKVL